MKVLVDHILGQQPLAGSAARLLAWLPGAYDPRWLLAWVALSGLGIFAVSSMLDVVLTFSWIRVGQRMVYDLIQDLFASVQRRSLLFHSRNTVGDTMSRITVDSWCVHTLADTLLFAPGHALITIVGMAVVMSRIDYGMTLLALSVAPVISASSLFFGKRIRRTARDKRERESRIQSHVQQTLSGIMVVQAFAQEEREYSRFREFARSAIRAQKRNTTAGSFYNLSSGLVSTLGTGLILYIGASHVLSGRLTVGSLLVFLAYHGTLQAQLKVFAGIYGALQGAGASVDRVMELLEAEPKVESRARAKTLAQARGQIKIENVTFGYEAERPILKGVTLEAEPGETIAIVGPTGAGKSTLVSLIPRFFDPWEGKVTIDAEDVREIDLKSLRSQIGIVLQEPFLFPLTIAENISYGRPDATREEIESAARAANAHQFIERLAEGYDTVIGERGATLSGGERQRLSIARALLKDAPILILDEPTSALDAQTEAMLLEALERLMKGRTTFIIAHRLSTIRKADRIVVIEDGEIVEVGTHRELLMSKGLYYFLHNLQFNSPVGTDRQFDKVESEEQPTYS